MTSAATGGLPNPPTPEHRRQAALQFERASQLVATGAHLAGIKLLVGCCRLDPANLLYRQALRRAEKAWFGHTPPRAWLAWLRTWAPRARLRAARSAGRYLKVLHLGERVLVYNPWDVATQREMAAAADLSGLADVAVWLLEQARHAAPNDADLNRELARRYEARGNFTQALALWDLVLRAAPDDEEARSKLDGAAAHQAVPAEQVAAVRSRIDAAPTRPDAYLELARLYRDAGRFDEAQVLLEGLPPTGHAFDLTGGADRVGHRAVPPRPRRDNAGGDGAARRQALTGIGPSTTARSTREELELYRLLSDRYPGRLVYRFEVGLRLLRAGQLAEAMEELQAVRSDASLEGPALIALAHGFRSRQHPRQALKHFS
ncbi:MAG: tetratricopeptide repeat protein [Gemmataceae bacterium]